MVAEIDAITLAVVSGAVLIVALLACLPAVLCVVRIRRVERQLGGATFTALLVAIEQRNSIHREPPRDG